MLKIAGLRGGGDGNARVPTVITDFDGGAANEGKAGAVSLLIDRATLLMEAIEDLDFKAEVVLVATLLVEVVLAREAGAGMADAEPELLVRARGTGTPLADEVGDETAADFANDDGGGIAWDAARDRGVPFPDKVAVGVEAAEDDAVLRTSGRTGFSVVEIESSVTTASELKVTVESPAGEPPGVMGENEDEAVDNEVDDDAGDREAGDGIGGMGGCKMLPIDEMDDC